MSEGSLNVDLHQTIEKLKNSEERLKKCEENLEIYEEQIKEIQENINKKKESGTQNNEDNPDIKTLNDQLAIIIKFYETAVLRVQQLREDIKKLKGSLVHIPEKRIKIPAKKQTNEDEEEDITNAICISIHRFVEKNFSSSPWEYDLLQDEDRIKTIFDKDNRLLLDLSKSIGKIGIKGFNNAELLMRDSLVCQMFDLNKKPPSMKCIFLQTFMSMFEDRISTYESEAACIDENAPIYQHPIKKYIKAAHYESSLVMLRDNCQSYDDTTVTNKTTNTKLQEEADLVEIMKKYKEFGALRPDSRIQDVENGRIFFRIEVKKEPSLLNEAENELVEKCFRLNRFQYGDIKIQFGLALAGNQASLYLISFKPKCTYTNCGKDNCLHQKVQKTNKEGLINIRRYDLNDVSDRIALVFSVMVITEISQQMRRKFPPLQEFSSFKHPDTINRKRNDKIYAIINFSYLLNMVEKEVKIEDEISSRDLLKDFYDLIPFDKTPKIGTRPVTDTVKVKFKPANKKFKLYIQPLGYNYEATMRRVNSSIDEFNKAIICVMEAALSMHANKFVHRDIRWPNITYDPERETYLLFDFEQIGKLCEWGCEDSNHYNFYCTPAILDAAFIIKLFDHQHLTIQQDEKYTQLAQVLEPWKLAQQFSQENKQATKSKRPNKRSKKTTEIEEARIASQIEETQELFWNFYDKHIETVKPNLTKVEIEERKLKSAF